MTTASVAVFPSIFPRTHVQKARSGAPIQDSKSAERVVLMRASALFAGLNGEECLEIARCARARTFARDESLFMQGQPPGSVVLIQSGSVKLTQLSKEGSEVILWVNGKGDAIGICPESLACSHTCTARALENCKALTWDRSSMKALLASYPQIRDNINRIMSNRLQELEERFREVATERVAKRLASALMRLTKQVGKEHEAGIRVSLSREELAQMTGTTLFTISRIISRWSEQGLILPEREAVVVRGPLPLDQIGNEEEEIRTRSARGAAPIYCVN